MHELLRLYVAYVDRFSHGRPWTLKLSPDGAGAIEEASPDNPQTVVQWNSPEEGVQKLQEGLDG